MAMVTFLKSAVPVATVAAGRELVSETVRSVIADIRSRGDAAVREYSERFDRWSPESFLLDAEEIERIVADVPQQVIDDIATVQANVRRFAQLQRDSMTEFEVEMAPGVHLGRKLIPITATARACPAAATR